MEIVYVLVALWIFGVILHLVLFAFLANGIRKMIRNDFVTAFFAWPVFDIMFIKCLRHKRKNG